MSKETNTSNNLALSDKEQSDLLNEITAIRQALKFLVSLTIDERKRLLKPGSNAIAACDSLIVTMKRHQKYFPVDLINIEEMSKNLALSKSLVPVYELLKSLTEAVWDTISVARSDAYRLGLRGYALAQMVANDVPGIESAIMPMREVLDKPSRQKKKGDRSGENT